MFIAEIAQLVEHNLAKVGVASSSLVFRSKKRFNTKNLFFYLYLYLLPLDIFPPLLDPRGPLCPLFGLRLLRSLFIPELLVSP